MTSTFWKLCCVYWFCRVVVHFIKPYSLRAFHWNTDEISAVASYKRVGKHNNGNYPELCTLFPNWSRYLPSWKEIVGCSGGVFINGPANGAWLHVCWGMRCRDAAGFGIWNSFSWDVKRGAWPATSGQCGIVTEHTHLPDRKRHECLLTVTHSFMSLAISAAAFHDTKYPIIWNFGVNTASLN
jgi:hypothetical protein